MMRKLLVVWLIVGFITLSACSNEMISGYDYEPVIEGSYNQDETYSEIIENEFIRTEDMPVSTFSTDVDTASYANVRRMVEDGILPIVDAIRIEGLINYFDYDLNSPSNDEVINVYSEFSQAPWNQEHQLLMVGLKAEEVVFEETDGMNLVFLIDVSGSMFADDKLPLLKRAFGLLIESLRPKDRISIVVYAGAAGVVLEGGDSTDKAAIYDALDDLQAGGSTAGGEGI